MSYPNVVSQAEYGARGMQALVAKYGEKQVAKWRRMGGRPRNRTWFEIEAERLEREREKAGTRRARRISTRQETPITRARDAEKAP